MMRPSIVIAAALAAVVLSAPVFAATWKKGSSYVWTGRGNVFEANGPAMVDGELAPIFEPAPGGVYVAGPKPLRLPNYGPVTVQAGKVIPWGNIVKGLRGLSTAGLAIDVGTAVWDWYNDAGVRPVECGPESTSCEGSTQWQVLGPDATTSATVVWVVAYGDTPASRYAPVEVACQAWTDAYIQYHKAMNPTNTAYTVYSVWVEGATSSSPICKADISYMWRGTSFTRMTASGNITREAVPWCIDKTGRAVVKPTAGKCPEGTWVDAPWGDVEPKLGAGPKDPNKGPDIWKDVVNRGGEVPDTGQPPTTKGPSQVQGPTSTTTGPNGTTTTSTTYHFTYNQNTVTVTETKTTTHPDGTQETTTSQPDVDAEVAPPADPDMPPVPDLYERKYPDGLKGVWEQKKAAFLESPLFQLIPGLTPSLGDAGCPVWSLPLGPWGTHDVSLPCWVWAAIRLIFICTALFTARKLIFGG